MSQCLFWWFIVWNCPYCYTKYFAKTITVVGGGQYNNHITTNIDPSSLTLPSLIWDICTVLTTTFNIYTWSTWNIYLKRSLRWRAALWFYNVCRNGLCRTSSWQRDILSDYCKHIAMARIQHRRAEYIYTISPYTVVGPLVGILMDCTEKFAYLNVVSDGNGLSNWWNFGRFLSMALY